MSKKKKQTREIEMTIRLHVPEGISFAELERLIDEAGDRAKREALEGAVCGGALQVAFAGRLCYNKGEPDHRERWIPEAGAPKQHCPEEQDRPAEAFPPGKARRNGWRLNDDRA